MDVSVTDQGVEFAPVPRGPCVPWLNIAMFLGTVFTTLLAGTAMSDEAHEFSLGTLHHGIPFSFTLLSILLVHEFGHFLLSRYHRVLASWPYFIPVPTFIGTFGALIRIRSPIPNRTALMDIGAAGPIAGFLVAVPAIVLGLQVSEVGPGAGPDGGLRLGDSLLMYLAEHLVFGELPDSQAVIVGPVAFAGWIGLLVTALNLMPIGQLDGGHITYAALGDRQGLIAKVFFVVMLALATQWPGWAMWAILGVAFRLHHPPTLNDHAPLGPGRRLIGWSCLAIFVLCFVPVPFSQL